VHSAIFHSLPHLHQADKQFLPPKSFLSKTPFPSKSFFIPGLSSAGRRIGRTVSRACANRGKGTTGEGEQILSRLKHKACGIKLIWVALQRAFTEKRKAPKLLVYAYYREVLPVQLSHLLLRQSFL
jgi:hypothetical protein